MCLTFCEYEWGDRDCRSFQSELTGCVDRRPAGSSQLFSLKEPLSLQQNKPCFEGSGGRRTLIFGFLPLFPGTLTEPGVDPRPTAWRGIFLFSPFPCGVPLSLRPSFPVVRRWFCSLCSFTSLLLRSVRTIPSCCSFRFFGLLSVRSPSAFSRSFSFFFLFFLTLAPPPPSSSSLRAEAGGGARPECFAALTLAVAQWFDPAELPTGLRRHSWSLGPTTRCPRGIVGSAVGVLPLRSEEQAAADEEAGDWLCFRRPGNI